jgi:hypothetical protein
MASKKTTLTLVCLGILALVVGCGSDDDSPSPTAPIDTAPPALVAGLAVDYDAAQSQAVVTWEPNVTDADLAGYLVSRGVFQHDPVALITAPQAASTFQDDVSNPGGSQVTYYVYSVDTSDNVSAAATVTLQLPRPVEDERVPVAQ